MPARQPKWRKRGHLTGAGLQPISLKHFGLPCRPRRLPSLRLQLSETSTYDDKYECTAIAHDKFASPRHVTSAARSRSKTPPRIVRSDTLIPFSYTTGSMYLHLIFGPTSSWCLYLCYKCTYTENTKYELMIRCTCNPGVKIAPAPVAGESDHIQVWSLRGRNAECPRARASRVPEMEVKLEPLA